MKRLVEGVDPSGIIVHIQFDGFEFLVGQRLPVALQEDRHLVLSGLIAESSPPEPGVVIR